MKSGAEYICEVLRDREVKCVFGLPGSQNVAFFSAMRKSTIRAVVTNHEMSAGFAALGYAATSNCPSVMSIIGGPGFTYAVTPLVEAKQDSIPIVCMLFTQCHDDGKDFHTQQLSYAEMVKDVCKEIVQVNTMEDFAVKFDAALVNSAGGDPGPVILLIDAQLQFCDCTELDLPSMSGNAQVSTSEIVQKVVERVRGQKLLILAGRGTMNCANQLQILAEKTGAPVITSTSARGVVPEDHPLSLVTDLISVDLINKFVSEYSVILAIGIRLGENSARGFRLNLPSERLIHVDASATVHGRNYAAGLCLAADASFVLSSLVVENLSCRSSDPTELDIWRKRFQESVETEPEPVVLQVRPATPRAFFDQLRSAMPRDGILVCDSGTHQMLARKYFRVLSPGGLLLPTNFQSMGYALTVALGSKIANQQRTVVALIGDGGFQMCGLELLAALKNKVTLVVIVFCDGKFGYIRQKQVDHDGYEYGVNVMSIDIKAFCASLSVKFSADVENLPQVLDAGTAENRPTVVQVDISDSPTIRRKIAISKMKTGIKQVAGRRAIAWLKKVCARFS